MRSGVLRREEMGDWYLTQTKPVFLATKEVSARLGRSREWVEEIRKRPGAGPPCYRIGNRYQYPESEFNTWLEKQRVG